MLDRLVFLRFLEDKLIEPSHLVAKFGEKGTAWQDFISASRRLDGIYNGIVFKKHDLLDTHDFIGDEEEFADICQKLCHINSPFLFNAIPIHILGNIYERFLGKVIVVTGNRALVKEKPEDRKAGGVYYTPEFIVRYIVDNTVGTLIQGKTPSRIAEMKFADIACGSGSFLLDTYDLLLQYHTVYYNQNRTKAKKGECVEKDGALHLSLHKKREILLNCIFGVDIDAQAVEVAQLSLYLKMLEEETTASAHMHQLEFHETLLPSLTKNIVCGNSLIGTNVFQSCLFSLDEKQERKLNAFDFTSAFPKILQQGGFDAIIGNPPYLNIDDTWGSKDIRLEAIKNTYPEIHTDKTDILFYFLARALALSKGKVGFIVSRAFLEAYKAEKLRTHLVGHAAIRELVDFRNHYVFPGVGITTCLIFYDPQARPGNLNVYNLLSESMPHTELHDSLKDKSLFENLIISQSSLSGSTWSFASKRVTDLNAKIDSMGDPLGTVLFIGQGMQTGENNVFGGLSFEQIEKWGLKQSQYFQRATNSDIDRYHIQSSGKYLLYLEDVAAFGRLPQGVQTYLNRHRNELEKRAACKRGDSEWWKYSWALHKSFYSRDKLLCPYLSKRNRFGLDRDKEFLGLTDTTVLFDNNQPEDIRYILGLLNSSLLTFRFLKIGKLKGGGILEYFENSISKLPIRRIDFNDRSEKAIHDQVVNLTDQIITTSGRLATAATDKDKNYLAAKCEALDQQISHIVYALYALNESEIKLVEDVTETL